MTPQRTLVIRIAAIILASDSAITLARFRPSKLASLEAQERYFSYRAIVVAIVSRNSVVLVFFGVSHSYRPICCKMGYRTDVPV